MDKTEKTCIRREAMRIGSKTKPEIEQKDYRTRKRESNSLRTIVCMWEDKNLLFYISRSKHSTRDKQRDAE